MRLPRCGIGARYGLSVSTRRRSGGAPAAAWHLELVAGGHPTPTDEDLLVLYLDGPVDDALVARLIEAGGRRIAQGAYWDRWGVTVADPDGYRLVLSTRAWSN